jgi:peptide/nickel transport system substrate-binding protein
MRRLLTCALLFAACKRAPPPAVDAPHAGGTLRVHMETEPPTLNPLVEHDYWTTWLTLGVIYEPLLRQDPKTGAFSPGLAARFELPDAQTIHLWLRDGVAWHDGRPFSADDVVATLDRLRGPGASADQRADFADLTKIDRPSPNELILRFARPAPLAAQALAHLAILPAHKFAEGDLRPQPASRAPVGTGPFRFVAWKAGESITIERNPAYWGRPPRLDRVELRIVRDREAAWELARRGELDLVWRLAPTQVDRPPPAGMTPFTWRMPTYSFVVWNLRRPGLGDKRVRQALTLLTDRVRYLQTAYRGRAQPITGPFPLGSPSYDTEVAPWPYDPARARALLDQAGVLDTDGDGRREIAGKPFEISFLMMAGSKTLEPLATMMQEDFHKAGIGLTIVPTEWAVLLDRLRKHAFDAAALQWNMQPVQDNYTLFYSAEGENGQNYGGFRDPDADRLLTELRRTPPGPPRVALDHQLHHLVHEQQPYTFLGCPDIVSLVSDRVRGYAPSVDGLGFAEMWLDR